MTPLQPVANNQRIWLMDALRGFAILGIFIANLSVFTYSFAILPDAQFASPLDHQVQFWHHVFLEGKFYSIFSFLFGWGIALQLMRNKETGLSGAAFVRRRLSIMFLLGCAHLLFLWMGDIVAFYALIGFVLLLMRNWKTKTLFITAIVLILSPILLYYLKMTFPVLHTPADLLNKTGKNIANDLLNVTNFKGAMEKVLAGTYADVFKFNIGGAFFRYSQLFFESRISKVLGMFILGYLMGRNGRYKRIMANKKLLWSIAIMGFFFGLPANYILAKYLETGAYYGEPIDGLYQTLSYAFGVAPLALAYIALFFLASYSGIGNKVLQQLRPVGKMAFSNYILHSVIGVFFFTGAGLGFGRQVGPLYYTLFGIMVFVLQIITSRIWLNYFEYGPVEWLWRSATYGKFQNIKKLPTPMVVVAEG